MDDSKIIELYFSRDEKAIEHTSDKYGRLCYYVAYNILKSQEDSEECVNDTYIRLWETIPPTVPQSLGAYSAKITRNLSLDKCKEKGAQKRGENDAPPSYEELEACLPSKDGEPVDELILKECINTFLASLDKEKRVIFIQRYFYMCEIKEIAKKNFLTEANVKVTLSRLREKFKKHLERY
ncbi:MAG: sigma-70 family RNA polymerase sigma factor [Clostridia bacterium]|nr:sigma-70 family RNA polymerase sigma factor [Clostridia bacterium]